MERIRPLPDRPGADRAGFSELDLPAGSQGKFFPQGIGLIELEISIGATETQQLQVKLKVEGLKPRKNMIEPPAARGSIDETTCAGSARKSQIRVPTASDA